MVTCLQRWACMLIVIGVRRRQLWCSKRLWRPRCQSPMQLSEILPGADSCPEPTHSCHPGWEVDKVICKARAKKSHRALVCELYTFFNFSSQPPGREGPVYEYVHTGTRARPNTWAFVTGVCVSGSVPWSRRSVAAESHTPDSIHRWIVTRLLGVSSQRPEIARASFSRQ